MAVETDDFDFDDFHFEAAQFDALLAANGTAVELRLAMPCACIRIETGQPDPACTACFPYGQLWDPPETLKVYGPNRKPTRRVDAPGTFEAGDAFFTFPSTAKPTVYSRLTLPTSQIRVSDILTKGSEDRIRFMPVLAVERARASRRNPPSGHPYVTEPVELVIGTDFTVDLATGVVTWLTNVIADGTRYVLRLLTLETYLLWEPQTRNEGGNEMPWRWLCRRVDFLQSKKGSLSY